MRNSKRINELKACIRCLEAKRKAAMETADGIEDDDEWNAECERIFFNLSPLELAKECGWLEYPEPRNDWFKSFICSFGMCDDRRISSKQMDIIERYAEREHEPEHGYGITYRCRIGVLRIKATRFPQRCYVTISEAPMSEIDRLVSLC